MLYLQPDLIEEILSRVPATSLKRLRSTCKRWNALLNNPRFNEKQFRRAPKESLALMLKENRIYPMSVNLNTSPPSIEFKGALGGLKNNSPRSEEVDIVEVFHCDGLLLCKTMFSKLVVWNPCLGETRWIIQTTRTSMFALGYENNKCGHIYKILKYCDGNTFPGLGVDKSEIYDFRFDRWRVLNHVAAPDRFLIKDIGVSLKGNTYWVADDVQTNSKFLLRFDFTGEIFTHL
ncbi:hypothetical protein CARUB_v10015671mg [Capsella rubella]|uniref:F-box domain-containing protein n=1 Tax=Capsella rubella TaxID=81985 RepID=R0HRI6_9BRAS|nr:putative F-box/kelch-repeat protein At3g22730 [Capsella rubella]EOA32399.1 hypothetical protein CARUB_v10015671mg [Capsella rubella]